jgi:hypothetical protein
MPTETLVKYLVQSALVLVLLVGMIWIVASPNVTDEVTKAALVVISSAAGYLFAKSTA